MPNGKAPQSDLGMYGMVVTEPSPRPLLPAPRVVVRAARPYDRVADLVYIAALAPGDDETSQSSINKFPTTEVFSHIEVADGRIWLRPEGIGSFAGDLSKEEQKVVWATPTSAY